LAVALRIATDVLAALKAATAQWPNAAGESSEALASAVHGGVTADCGVVASFGDSLLTEDGLKGRAVQLWRFGSTIGALPYRSPEELGPLARADDRSDVFSVGVLLWEMLANRALFGSESRLGEPGDRALDSTAAETIRGQILAGMLP